MKVAVFGIKPDLRHFLSEAIQSNGHQFTFYDPQLTPATSYLAQGFDAVCVFVNDQVNAETLANIAAGGVRLVALYCSGFNNVDLVAAAEQGITVMRVPAYSPYSVAEHAITLILSLNRRIYKAYNRVREGNFELRGLLGFDVHGTTAGIIGTGKIGVITAKILQGFGCHVLAYDLYKNPDCESAGIEYVDLPVLLGQSDIISLHCPLTPETYHLIDAEAVAKMKPGVMLVNTSRGALIDTQAVIDGLKSEKIGYLGLDVYEEEADLFFQDLSNQIIHDDLFERLLTFPNVLITAHQAFFTKNALKNIVDTTLENLNSFAEGQPILSNVVTLEKVSR